MEKASLRSPEVALPVILDFFRTFHPAQNQEKVQIISDFNTFKRISALSLNATKSSNATVRSEAVALLGVVLDLEKEKNSNADAYSYILGEVLTPAKTGKTMGPEHRSSLFSVLAFIPATSELLPLSLELITSIPQLLAKESNESAITTLCSAAKPHLISLLRQDTQVGSIPSFVAEMKSTKPAVRRAVYNLVGGALYETFGSCSRKDTGIAMEKFISSIAPVLENSVSTVASSPLTSPAGPLEGYIAIACLLGPVAKYKLSGQPLSFLVSARD